MRGLTGTQRGSSRWRGGRRAQLVGGRRGVSLLQRPSARARMSSAWLAMRRARSWASWAN